MKIRKLLKASALSLLLAAGLLPAVTTAVEYYRYPPTMPLVAIGAGTPWNALTPGEQEILQKHRRDWNDYPPEKQDRLRDGAQRYLDLPQDKRDKVRRKQEQYRKLPPDERKRLREQYRRQRSHQGGP